MNAGSAAKLMRRCARIAALVALVALAACAWLPRETSPQAHGGPAGPGPSASNGLSPVDRGANAPAVAAPARPGPLVRQTGSLTLTIIWPDRPDSRHVAAIPASANSLILTISSAGSLVMPPQVAKRPPGGGTQVVAIEDVPAGNNLGLEVTAYSEADPKLGVSVVLARGTAAVNIQTAKRSSASIKMVPANEPSISSLSANVGMGGLKLVLLGNNLDPVAGATPSVEFNASSGVAQGAVKAIDPSRLEVTVPAGAVTGRVVVRRDGIPSQSEIVFWVVSGLTIDAEGKTQAGTALGFGQVYYGDTLRFTASATFAFKGGENAGTYGSPPTARYLSSHPIDVAQNAIDSLSGVLTAATRHATTSVTADLGGLKSNEIQAESVGVDAVTVNPAVLSLNARPADGAPVSAALAASVSATISASVRTSLAFDKGVSWSSSNISFATVDASGSVSGAAGASAGTAIITARSVVNPAKLATVTVTVTDLGNLRVKIQ
jgi:hypothetical protein